MDENSLNIQLELTPRQDEAWDYLNDRRTIEILFGGGSGGGKSKLGCFFQIVRRIQYPGTHGFIGRARLSDLKKSTLITLFDTFRQFGIKRSLYNFNKQDNVITLWNESQIYLLELDYYPSDPDYERIGSMEFTDGFIDETAQITSRARDVARARIRYMLSEFGLTPKLYMTCNPSKNWLYEEFYKPWKKKKLGRDKAFVRALALDNPHNNPAYLESLKNIKDRVLRERLWFGNWEYEDDEAALFLYDALTDLFTNKVDASADRYLICDAARLGRDRIVMMVWEGLKVIRIKVFEKMPTDKVEEELDKLATEYKVPRSHELVDEEGVGGGIVDHRKCKGFIGSSSPIQPKDVPGKHEYKVNYLNLRAQCYYTLADYTNEHKIAVVTENSEYRQFITEELEQTKRKDPDKDGKLAVIPKEEIKEHLGRSPDFADCLMMRMYFEVNPIPQPNIRFL